MKPILLIFLISLIAACDQGGHSTVDKEKFEAFLKTKRIPMNDEVRYQRLLAEYQSREALANAISNTDELDATLIDAEIEEFRKELLISRYFESYLKGAVTEQGIQNHYSENVDTYKTRKARISHILFRLNPRMSEAERQVALTKATEAHSKVVTGEGFAEVAKELSEDKISAQKGGDLGWVNEGAISKAFSEKVFAMQAGDLSEPFVTEYGFHVVKMIEAPQDVVKPLQALKGDIRYQLRSESKKAETLRLLNSVDYQPQG